MDSSPCAKRGEADPRSATRKSHRSPYKLITVRDMPISFSLTCSGAGAPSELRRPLAPPRLLRPARLTRGRVTCSGRSAHYLVLTQKCSCRNSLPELTMRPHVSHSQSSGTHTPPPGAGPTSHQYGGSSAFWNLSVTSPDRSTLLGLSTVTAVPASRFILDRSTQITFGLVVSSK